jgi:hypothetical protein
MADVVRALIRAEEGQGGRDERVHLIEVARAGRAEERLELGKGLLDRIEVRTVRGEEAELGAGGFDGGLHVGLFMHGQVVEDHDIARPEGRHEHLFDVGPETRLVDRPVEDGRGGQPRHAEAGDHRVRLPVPAGGVVSEPVAAWAAPIPAQQIRGHATFIEKHVALHVAQRLPRAPLPARRHDVRPALLVGVYGFF